MNYKKIALAVSPLVFLFAGAIAHADTLPILSLTCSPKSVVAAKSKSITSISFQVDLNTLLVTGRFDYMDMINGKSDVLIADGLEGHRLTAKKLADKLSVTMSNTKSMIAIDISNKDIDAILRGDAKEGPCPSFS